MKKYIKIHKKDNVFIAIEKIEAGAVIENIQVLEEIPIGHKVATEDILKGKHVVKYGQSIGCATQDIKRGSWIHTHNLKTNLHNLGKYKYLQKPYANSFKGFDREIEIYRRGNGKIGIRNELWIVPTVGCVNGIAKIAMNEFQQENSLEEIDGVNVMTHNYGCSQMGDDHVNTRTILQDLIKHPNCGGVLVLGVGCENNQISVFEETLGEYDRKRTKFLVAQEVEDEIEEIKKILGELYENMRKDRREKGKLSELSFGLECGGSDGFSGITANPLLGKFSDYIINNGGTTVLTEVPEMFGAEHLLMERCENMEVFQKTVTLVNEFKEFFLSHNQVIYENPSPGNKKGGITTLEEKSLGCTEKSGTTLVKDVLGYGEILKCKGLNLLESPGNDLVATTALAAAGCQMVLFTTGRGNPYGGFVPTVKISTNTPLAQLKKRWIDFDAGKLVSKDVTMEDMLEEFVDFIVEIADGKKVNNEKNNFKELAIFKTGVTL
ncbi:MAG: UxaA family hydrolase [Fusobacteriaceae bacterium]